MSSLPLTSVEDRLYVLRTRWERYVADGRQKTDYAGLDGKSHLTVDGYASGYSEGHAVSRLSSSAMRAVDGKGALTGPAFGLICATDGPATSVAAAAKMNAKPRMIFSPPEFIGL